MKDNGADVVKVETPEGEGMRRGPRAPGSKTAADQFLWEVFNRGKRSVTPDLKHPSAKGVMERLVKWADLQGGAYHQGGVEQQLQHGGEVAQTWATTSFRKTLLGKWGGSGQRMPRVCP